MRVSEELGVLIIVLGTKNVVTLQGCVGASEEVLNEVSSHWCIFPIGFVLTIGFHFSAEVWEVSITILNGVEERVLEDFGVLNVVGLIVEQVELSGTRGIGVET